MHIIEVSALAHVVGGCNAQQQAPQAPEQAAPGGGAPPTGESGGSLTSGLASLLGFFQSDGFKQLLGGLQSLIGQGGQAAQPAAGQ